MGVTQRQWAVQKRILVCAHAHLAICIYHKHSMQHVAFGYRNAATTRAQWAFRPTLISWTNVSPIWHVCMWRLKPLSAPISSALHTPQPRVIDRHRRWC
eukprot:8088970-Pyramimonas_sp.AAC.1